MIDEMKRFLHEQQLPVEWLAIETRLPVRTVNELLARKRRMIAKYEERFCQVLARHGK